MPTKRNLRHIKVEVRVVSLAPRGKPKSRRHQGHTRHHVLCVLNAVPLDLLDRARTVGRSSGSGRGNGTRGPLQLHHRTTQSSHGKISCSPPK